MSQHSEHPRVDRRLLLSALFRFQLYGLACILWLAGVFDGRSLQALVAARAEGFVLLSLLMLAGVIGLLDMVINDIFPEKYYWDTLRRHRHFGLMTMAACYIGQLFVAFDYVRSVPLFLFYFFLGSTTVVFAFVDAHQRYKETISCPNPVR
jgi:hypothetical protein